MEWKMQHWKDLVKLCKVTYNEHRENLTPKTPKWGTKKMKKIKEGQNYTWSSNSIIRRSPAFELKEDKLIATIRTLSAAFKDTES